LHLLAIAREADIPLTIEDFDLVSERTPVIADLKPGGRYTAVDLDRAGGTRLLGKRLLDAGLIDGTRITTTGRTIGDEVEAADETSSGGASDGSVRSVRRREVG
jgi:dihydroxy-acid dehydratase